MRRPNRILLLLIFTVVAAFQSCAMLAQPLPAVRLYSVFPPGARQGTTFDVTIAGEDLEKAAQLHFSQPGITAVQKTQPPALGQEGPQPLPGQFTLTVAPDAPLGLCEVCAIGKYGVSNPRLRDRQPTGTRRNRTQQHRGAGN